MRATVSGTGFSSFVTILLSGLLSGYKRLISPFLPSACRFYPTCSEYMREAVETHGPAQGVWLGMRRLCRCHPFHEGGFDAVPKHRISSVNDSSNAPQ